jgi:23S rRNA pseudouridine2605 synthase
MARRHEDRRPGARPQRQGGGAARGAGRRPARTSRRARGLHVTAITAGAPAVEADGKVRLNRFLAMSGVCSRRAADEFIAGGRVEVNGRRATELGLRIDPAHDRVAVDGEPVRREKPVYVLCNKPKGVVCTNARHEQKKRVIDLLPEVRGRLFTVGRLDLDSEGLILVTNDGAFAQRMTHPRFGVPKVYAVLVRGRVDARDLQKARGGVWLAEGPTAGMRIKVERAGRDRTYMKVMLREGRNREIRRVFARLGFPVLELKRIRIGELSLHGLAAGQWRFLQPHEVQGLVASARPADREPAAEEQA